MEVFSSRTANESWLLVARALRDRGSVVDSRAGVTREILHAALVVADPRQRWVVSRLPAINPAFALAEVVWIVTGRSDAVFLTHWNPRLTRFVGTRPQLYGAYGARLRHTHGIDQLRAAYEALTANPATRQVVLQIWSAALDSPGAGGLPRSEDIPCNISSCLKLRGGALHWLQTLRSNDVFLGVPHNLVQFTTLQEIIAGWLGVDVGEYVQISDSLHLYDHNRLAMTLDESVVLVPNTDRFADGFEASMNHFANLGRLMDALIRWDGERQSSVHAEGLSLPTEYANIFAVVAADDYRRRRDMVNADAAMARCTNTAYAQLWERWCRRQGGSPSGSSAPGVVVHSSRSRASATG